MVGQYVWKKVSMYVCMYVCMYVSLSSFYLYLLNHALKLNKTCMNINKGHAAILPFHDFHLRGQTKVAYIRIFYKTSSFICISRPIFWKTFKERPSPQRSNNCGICINMFLKHPLRHDLFSSKHIEMSCLDIISWL